FACVAVRSPPPSASPFPYTTLFRSEVLGSFTSDNNTDLNLLPIQPIGGDELIVEYQEPLNAEFEGEIEIGEVNHDFVGIFRATRSEEHTSELQSRENLVCRLLLEKK